MKYGKQVLSGSASHIFSIKDEALITSTSKTDSYGNSSQADVEIVVPHD